MQVPDSAATATAMLCGVKTRQGVLGLNKNVERGVCMSEKDNEEKSILKYAIDNGKTGTGWR